MTTARSCIIRWIGTLETIPPGIVLGIGGPHLGGAILENTGLSAGDIDGVSRLYGKIPTQDDRHGERRGPHDRG